MSVRALCLGLTVAASFAIGAARAQTPEELMGTYPVTVSTVGSDCPREGPARFQVVSISGKTLVFRLDGKESAADYHPPSLSFRKELHGPGDPRAINGRFTRGPETVGLEIDWNSGACQIHMEGERSASLLAGATPADAAAPAASQPGPPWVRELGFYGLLFGVGAGVVLLFRMGSKKR